MALVANALNLQIPVPVAQGGTGASTLTSNAILLGNGTSTVNTASLTTGQLLVGTATAPQGLTLTAHGIVIGEGAANPTSLVLTNGQMLVGSTGNDPATFSLNANEVVIGGGTAAPSTVSLAAGQVLVGTATTPVGSSIAAFTSFVTATGATQTVTGGTLYFSNNTSAQTVYTLPNAPALNTITGVIGLNTAFSTGWKVVAQGTDKIQFNDQLSAAAGNVVSGSNTDAVFLIYAATNLWVVYDAMGLSMSVT